MPKRGERKQRTKRRTHPPQANPRIRSSTATMHRKGVILRSRGITTGRPRHQSRGKTRNRWGRPERPRKILEMCSRCFASASERSLNRCGLYHQEDGRARLGLLCLPCYRHSRNNQETAYFSGGALLRYFLMTTR